MSVRITKIIWLLAFVASVAVYFDFRDDARVTATSPGTPVFTPFTLDTISAIHIERTNTVLRIQSSPEGWTLSNGDSQSIVVCSYGGKLLNLSPMAKPS